jgi:hypothetical protein
MGHHITNFSQVLNLVPCLSTMPCELNPFLLFVGVPNICAVDWCWDCNRHWSSWWGCLPYDRCCDAAGLSPDASNHGVRGGLIPCWNGMHFLPCRDKGPRYGLMVHKHPLYLDGLAVITIHELLCGLDCVYIGPVRLPATKSRTLLGWWTKLRRPLIFVSFSPRRACVAKNQLRGLRVAGSGVQPFTPRL